MKSVPSPARLGFQLGEQEQAVAVEGQAPSQLPPGPLPANQGLIAAGLAQQLHLLAGGPSCYSWEGAQPFVPASWKPSGQKVAALCSQCPGLPPRAGADYRALH